MNGPVSTPQSTTRVDRTRTVRSRKEIDRFFKEKRWISKRGAAVQAAYVLWPGEAEVEPLQFLFLVQKRNVPKAHDRNQLKRWLRAAVHEVGDFEAIADHLESRRLLLLLSVSSSPEEIDWQEILGGVQRVAQALQREVATSRSTQPITSDP